MSNLVDELSELEKKIVLIDDRLDVVKNEHFKILGLSVEVYKSYINKKEEFYDKVKSEKSSLEKIVEDQKKKIDLLNDKINQLEQHISNSDDEEEEDEEEEKKIDEVLKVIEKESVPLPTKKKAKKSTVQLKKRNNETN